MNLAGKVTIRAPSDSKGVGGEIVRSHLVVAGIVTAAEGPQSAQSGETAAKAAGGRLRMVYRDVPVVETRDLAIYEEVARAASLG